MFRSCERHFSWQHSMLRGVLGLLLAAHASLLMAAMPPQTKDRPNILWIFTDDQAPWAVGVSGYPHALTPNLDRLFKQGAYLSRSFTVTPVCSPSRASLMTSRYGSELGITDWINPRKEPDHGLDPKWPVWPKLLQAAGYRTGLVGKWHLGTLDRFHPTRMGFDYFMGFRDGGTTPSNPTLESEGESRKFTGLTADILTQHSLTFLDRAQKQSQPFLLCLHFRAPHARWLPVADEDWAPLANLDPTLPHPDYPKLDTERVKKMTREYLASVRSVDRNVGRVLQKLEELKLADNTIVVFSSDHGYNMGHNGIWHKGNGHWVLTEAPPFSDNIPKNQRPNMYDNSLLVPTAVYWPGVTRAGSEIQHTVSNLDWFPTFLEMANVPRPSGITLRGRSIVPLLRGSDANWNDDLYAEYSTHHQSRTHMRMYRTPRWKLVRDFLNEGRDELYDLQADPEETKNLYARIESDSQLRAIVSELDLKIRQRMKELGDPVAGTPKP